MITPEEKINVEIIKNKKGNFGIIISGKKYKKARICANAEVTKIDLSADYKTRITTIVFEEKTKLTKRKGNNENKPRMRQNSKNRIL